MRYTPATVAKAFMAFITAFGGSAATSAPHDTIGWAGCVGAGLVAFAAVFATPNKTDTPAPADQVINGAQALKDAQDFVAAERERAAQAVTGILGSLPVVGPLAAQAINSFK
jgi:putative transposon-encoded protein